MHDKTISILEQTCDFDTCAWISPQDRTWYLVAPGSKRGAKYVVGSTEHLSSTFSARAPPTTTCGTTRWSRPEGPGSQRRCPLRRHPNLVVNSRRYDAALGPRRISCFWWSVVLAVACAFRCQFLRSVSSAQPCQTWSNVRSTRVLVPPPVILGSTAAFLFPWAVQKNAPAVKKTSPRCLYLV